MSIENARLAYPILVGLARELAHAVRERRNQLWISYDDLCNRCKEVGIKETPRTIVAKVLRSVQLACLQHDKPDLSALIIQKPKARSDFGNLIRPSDGWWEPYIERGDVTAVDVGFWFKKYQAARDYDEWPETPFF